MNKIKEFGLKRIKKASTFIFILVLSFFILFTVLEVTSAAKSIQGMEMQIRIKEAEINRKERNLENELQNLEELERLGEELSDLQSSILPKSDIQNQILEMDSRIEGFELKALEFSVSPIMPITLNNQQNIYFARFNIRVIGEIENILLFIDSLEKGKPFYYVDSISIYTTDDNVELKTEVHLYYKTNER